MNITSQQFETADWPSHMTSREQDRADFDPFQIRHVLMGDAVSHRQWEWLYIYAFRAPLRSRP